MRNFFEIRMFVCINIMHFEFSEKVKGRLIRNQKGPVIVPDIGRVGSRGQNNHHSFIII